MSVQMLTTKAEFDTAITSSNLVVVDFYTDWCGPCKAIAPKVAGLATEETGVTFCKMDLDKHGASFPDIRSIPTFRMFKDGKMLFEFAGADFNKLKSKIAELK